MVKEVSYLVSKKMDPNTSCKMNLGSNALNTNVPLIFCDAGD